MRILVACEFSGVVREAFKKRGHDVWSCDLLPTEQLGNHLQCDVLSILQDNWDLMIAHPPCTYLAGSGARWWKNRRKEQAKAVEFVCNLLLAPIPKIVLENPVGLLSSVLCKPSQIINPWQFGHGEKKRTCLWLKNLPLLQPTKVVEGREPKIHYMAPSKDRWKLRSITYQGIADAMAEQWG